MSNYSILSEFLGTILLVFLGESAVAAHLLNGSLFKGAGANFIFMGWGLALGLPTMCFYKISGAYFNPAVTLGFAITGSFPWKSVPGYIGAELLGGFIGACLVYLFYKDQFNATKNPDLILKVFVTKPRKIHYLADTFSETIGTILLVIFSVSVPGLATNNGYNGLYTTLIILSLSYSLGGITGLAMNPARDLMPRLAHQLLPIKHKGPSMWNYALVPVIGPILGAVIGAWLSNNLSSYLYPNLY